MLPGRKLRDIGGSGRPPAPPEMVAKVKAMTEAGQGPTAIGRLLGIDRGTVRRLLKAN